MTKVKDIIDIGETIADDVTRVADRQDDGWARVGDGIPGGVWQCDKGQIGDVRSGDVLAFEWGPLTVTAVREPKPERTLIGPPHAHLDAPCTDRCYETASAEPEPQQAETSALLDLVRQYGAKREEVGLAIGGDPDEVDRFAKAASALFDRIAALVLGDAVKVAQRALLDEIADLLDVGAYDDLVAELRRRLAPADPSVLSLPQVPPGTVALVVQFKGQEIRFEPYAEGGWIRTDWEGESWDLPALLEEFGPARVVMREPRTWPRLDGPDDDPAVRGASGRIWRRVSPTVWACVGVEDGEECENFAALQQYDGPLTEVFADEPGGVA